MSNSPGLDVYKLAFQVSPIILTGGIANYIPGGMLPIISITEALNFVGGILSSGRTPKLDDFFASFQVMPGGTLIDQAIGHYPFANQAVAANAVIAQPLKVSLIMRCPVRQSYAAKLATMLALQTAIQKHNASGGTYIVATPSYFYTNTLLTGLKDVTSGRSKQVQTEWQWDFEQPLLTEAQAEAAQNSLMSKITGGTALTGEPAWSSFATVVGQPPSIAAAGVIPAASSTAASNIAPS